jgi:peptidoglycan hydrolase-like protein with peptidoglycan-binding domain
MRYGLDSTASPSVSAMNSHGADFMVRYVSSWGNSKNLTLAEAQRLSAGGIDIVVVAEWDIRTWMGGYPSGKAGAATAHAQAVSCGMPADRPLYFAVDDDATLGGKPTSPLALSQMNALRNYLQGAADALGGWHRVGCYAGYFVLEWLFEHTPLAYGWNTLAWSYRNWHPRAQLRQETFNVWIENLNFDGNHAFAVDFGQWRVGCATKSLDLKSGDTGADVKTLQANLNKLNAKPPLTVDGSFGPATDTAVRAFQAFAKIAVDGSVGPTTRQSMQYFLGLTVKAVVVKPPTPPTNRYVREPTIKLGATGIGVKTLQLALNSCFGARLVVDSNFGHMTDAAVRLFQSSPIGGKLVVDGICGPTTFAKLDLVLDWQGK